MLVSQFQRPQLQARASKTAQLKTHLVPEEEKEEEEKKEEEEVYKLTNI